MQISRRSLVTGTGAFALAGMLPVRAWAEDESTQLSPDLALARLERGNGFFSKSQLQTYDISKERRAAIAKGQTPFAAILCCSDSRAAPEQIFQVGLGDLFVVRAAGSTAANPQAIGSLEYAVAEFKVPLIVVLGHSKCGAAKEATNIVANHTQFPGSLEPMLWPLLPAAIAMRVANQDDWIEATTHENVIRIRDNLRLATQPVLYPPQRDRVLKVVGAVYDLVSGVVSFLPG